ERRLAVNESRRHDHARSDQLPFSDVLLPSEMYVERRLAITISSTDTVTGHIADPGDTVGDIEREDDLPGQSVRAGVRVHVPQAGDQKLPPCIDDLGVSRDVGFAGLADFRNPHSAKRPDR